MWSRELQSVRWQHPTSAVKCCLSFDWPNSGGQPHDPSTAPQYTAPHTHFLTTTNTTTTNIRSSNNNTCLEWSDANEGLSKWHQQLRLSHRYRWLRGKAKPIQTASTNSQYKQLSLGFRLQSRYLVWRRLLPIHNAAVAPSTKKNKSHLNTLSCFIVHV